MKGCVFDIQKFSLNDGPGIRTTVFLKGCRLKCQWCSNPESWCPNPQLLFDENKCTSCGNCADRCAQKAVSIMGNVAVTNPTKCTACGECVKVCSGVARRISGYQIEDSEIISILKKDIPYFRNSGGGLTLSGGEVLDHAEFAASILMQAKKENIHTCIETSGNGTAETFEHLLQYTDLVLLDYKLTDELSFKKYTNGSHKNTQKSLNLLEKQKTPVWLRCPIIPGLNDNKEHFKVINNLGQKYENILRIEILPYHSYGSHKFKQAGIDSGWLCATDPTPEIQTGWEHYLTEIGCTKLYLKNQL